MVSPGARYPQEFREACRDIGLRYDPDRRSWSKIVSQPESPDWMTWWVQYQDRLPEEMREFPYVTYTVTPIQKSERYTSMPLSYPPILLELP